MKFKVGDRVRVRKDLKYNNFYGGVRVNDEMVNNKGKILTIIGIDNGAYLMEGSQWFWTDEMFESKEYTYEDLKKSPMGTKITFKDGRTLVKTCKTKFENCEDISLADKLVNFEDKYYGKIIKIEEPTYTTVYEAKVEILDDVEKRYLKGVIRPFRNNVEVIRKLFSPTKGKYYIQIKYKDEPPTNLPYFESKEMYKNMKIDWIYTLEELGL